jgi:hypothetical protein
MNMTNDTVIRVKHDRSFVIMSNYFLLHQNDMTSKSKGILSTMLALPENWNYNIKGISYYVNDGVYAVRTALDEMERLGYLKRRQLRDEHGRFYGVEYTVYEEPYYLRENAAETAEKPLCENSHTENSNAENHTLSNIEEKNTDCINIIAEAEPEAITAEKTTSDTVSSEKQITREDVENQINAATLKTELTSAFVNGVVDIIQKCRNSGSKIISGKRVSKDELNSRFAAITYDDVQNLAKSVSNREMNNPECYMRAVLYNGSYSCYNTAPSYSYKSKFTEKENVNAYEWQKSSFDVDEVMRIIRMQYSKASC